MPSPSTVSVAFLNENTLGHTSYLPRFVDHLQQHPDLGITPHRIDVTPLPPDLQRRADFSIRGLRKVGLDFHIARWRRVVSTHARHQIENLRRHIPLHAIVVNTQSVALDLADLAAEIPTFVCLDATFAQLARSAWFRMNRVAGWFLPLTLAPIRSRERRALAAAHRLLPWSAPVRDSLLGEYQLPDHRIEVLPPSLDLAGITPFPQRPATPHPASAGRNTANPKPRFLFLGGDFRRKGGPTLLEAFRSRFSESAELHVVTQSDVPQQPGVFVHRGITAGSDAWREQWSKADAFVFPSRLETFGIVLVEAMAFGVPVIASDTGAAADLLNHGSDGLLLPDPSPASLATAMASVLTDPAAAVARARRARARVERDFDLTLNSARLAERLHAAVHTARPR